MKSRIAMLVVFVLIVTACNLPSSVTITATPSPAPRSTSPKQLPSPTPIPIPSQSPTPTALPSDLPFTIDCSALDASRQADCDAYIAATRDVSYPILKEVTGVSLSKCYKEMHYIILPTDPASGAGGLSGGDTITYNKAYSIDLRHRYDVHELLHSISSCARALDGHAFHGLVKNYVYDRLGVHDPGYFDEKSSENLTIGLELNLEKVKTASGEELIGNCRGILLRKMTRVFFDLGPQTVAPLYQSTISPSETTTPPNPNLSIVWGKNARQVEVLLETLKQDYKYSIDVPECGY